MIVASVLDLQEVRIILPAANCNHPPPPCCTSSKASSIVVGCRFWVKVSRYINMLTSCTANCSTTSTLQYDIGRSIGWNDHVGCRIVMCRGHVKVGLSNEKVSCSTLLYWRSGFSVQFPVELLASRALFVFLLRFR